MTHDADDDGDEAWDDADAAAGDEAWDDDEGGGDDDWGEFVDDGDDDGGGDDGQGGGDIVWVQIDNLFYEADDNRRRNPELALAKFQEVVELEKEAAGDRIVKRFKALEQIVSLQLVLGKHKEMLSTYMELLSLTRDTQVTSNERSQAINAILNAVSERGCAELVAQVYQTTLDQLKKLGNQERMYMNVCMKLCRAYLEQNRLEKVERMLKELHAMCQHPDGTDDRSKGSELLEIYAIEVQLLAAQGDSLKMKDLFAKTKNLSAEVNDPRSMSIIQECWGKSYAGERQWELAYTEFWDAFLQFQQIGHPRAKVCLKYVIFLNMLSSRVSNPFDATEARVYLSDPDIESLVQLHDAYDTKDIHMFLAVLQQQRAAIDADPFVKQIVAPLIREIRGQAVLRIVRPYRRIRLDLLSSKLQMEVDELQQLLVELIIEESLDGRIDQVQGVLELQQPSGALQQKYKAVDMWADALDKLCQSFARATCDFA